MFKTENNNNLANPSTAFEYPQKLTARLKELKYSFPSNQELPELTDDMLFRAAHPKKIGIFSSGGLSNQIVDNIRAKYLNEFQESDFEIFLETFDRSIVPSRAVDSSPQESTSQEKDNHLHNDTHTTISAPGPEDVELIFESDAEFELDNPDMSPEMEGFVELEDAKVTSETESARKPEGTYESDKSQGFRERASQVFYELKKRLGLIKIEHKPIESPPAGTSGEKSILEDNLELTKQLDTEPSKPHKNIVKIVRGMDIIFIFTCLDDEYDIENTMIISELAKKTNILSIVLVSLPRYFGKVENVYATNKTLQKLRLIAEIVILVPYFETFKFKLIPQLIQEILDVITRPGLINVDVADLKIIVKGGNVGIVSFGKGQHITRHKDALFEAIDSKLLNVELAGVEKALLNVTGGQDMMLAEVEGLADQIKSRIKPEARFILGTIIDPTLKDTIKIFLLLGVPPMQVMINKYANE